MKEKSATVDVLQLLNQSVVTPHELRLECVPADKGGEYTSSAFRRYCRDVGIKPQSASTNTPQQIRANERIARTLVGMLRCLLADSGLPHFRWGELFMTASYLSNRAPQSALDNVTPFEVLHGKKAYLGHLRAIGARAFVTWRPIPTSLMLVPGKDGWLATASTANLFRFITRKRGEYARAATSSSLRHRRSCRNQAWCVLFSIKFMNQLPETFGLRVLRLLLRNNLLQLLLREILPHLLKGKVLPLLHLLQREVVLRVVGIPGLPIPRVAGLRQLLLLVTYVPATSTQLESRSSRGTSKIPDTFGEAMELAAADLWKQATEREIKSLQELKGWNQVPGKDCDGTVAPVGRLQSVRMVLAIAAEMDWEVRQLDVKTSFLYADLEEDVFVKMAPGFEARNANGHKLVMKLGVSLYGLAQSPQNWWKTIDPKLIELGFEPLKSESCVYIYQRNNTVVIITLYVDDRLVIGGKHRTTSQLARAMSKPAKVHMGAAKHRLGYLAGTPYFCITYKRGGFKLTTFSDANWGNNPDNAKSTSSYMIVMSKAPESFKTGLQSLRAVSTMMAELVAAALTMKEVVVCSNMMTEIGSGQQFGQVPFSRTKHIAIRFFYLRELVKEGAITIHYVSTDRQLADIGTKFLSKHCLRLLLNLIKNFEE
ncbi:unnamed protein product [Ectocarpus sp. CCAP 1310/34]|nr:unnamed protein product [Ectocarpus sp. CCAP 1310/34]